MRQGSRSVGEAPAGARPASTRLHLRSGGHARTALVLPAEGPAPAPALLAFHGLGDSGMGLLARLGDLTPLAGVTLVLPDALPCPPLAGAPCWPAEAGAPIRERELAFVEDLVGVLTGRADVVAGPPLVLGYSNGAGWVTQLLLDRPDLLAGAVIVAGFDPTRRFARSPDGLLAWPLRPLTPSAAAAPRLRRPVTLVHGGDDEAVPVALGRALAARLRQLGWGPHDVRLETHPGAGHSDPALLAASGLARHLRWLAEHSGLDLG